MCCRLGWRRIAEKNYSNADNAGVDNDDDDDISMMRRFILIGDVNENGDDDDFDNYDMIIMWL